jgi:hypothetical protein
MPIMRDAEGGTPAPRGWYVEAARTLRNRQFSLLRPLSRFRHGAAGLFDGCAGAG